MQSIVQRVSAVLSRTARGAGAVRDLLTSLRQGKLKFTDTNIIVKNWILDAEESIALFVATTETKVTDVEIEVADGAWWTGVRIEFGSVSITYAHSSDEELNDMAIWIRVSDDPTRYCLMYYTSVAAFVMIVESGRIVDGVALIKANRVEWKQNATAGTVVRHMLAMNYNVQLGGNAYAETSVLKVWPSRVSSDAVILMGKFGLCEALRNYVHRSVTVIDEFVASCSNVAAAVECYNVDDSVLFQRQIFVALAFAGGADVGIAAIPIGGASWSSKRIGTFELDWAKTLAGKPFVVAETKVRYGQGLALMDTDLAARMDAVSEMKTYVLGVARPGSLKTEYPVPAVLVT